MDGPDGDGAGADGPATPDGGSAGNAGADATTDGRSADTADADASSEGAGRTYSGVLTAFPYAYRASESRLFRSYALVGGLIGAGVTVMFAIAVVVLLGNTAGASGGTFTFSRALFFVLLLFVLVPLVAPVLLVARRHRRGGSTGRYDAALALSGYLFLVALYVSLAITTPERWQEDPSGTLAPVAEVLYSLPAPAAVGPPLAAVAVMALAHRRLA